MKTTRYSLATWLSALHACCTFAGIHYAVAEDWGEWEKLPDGSVGQVTEFMGVNDTPIAAYLRKPKGDGPFPVVVMIHGGGQSKQGTYALGRMTAAPIADFIAEGWRLQCRLANSAAGQRTTAADQ